jgi:hypothetical protein
MKNKIKQIVIVSGDGIGISSVGENGVTEIRCESLEYPDHVFSCYTVWKGIRLFKRIENCPVDVTFETQGGEG